MASVLIVLAAGAAARACQAASLERSIFVGADGEPLPQVTSPSRTEQPAECNYVPEIMFLQQGTHLKAQGGLAADEPRHEGTNLIARELATNNTQLAVVMEKRPGNATEMLAEPRGVVEPKKPPIAAELVHAELIATVDRGSQSSLEAAFWRIDEVLSHSPASLLSKAVQAVRAKGPEERSSPRTAAKVEASLLEAAHSLTMEEELTYLDKFLLLPSGRKEIALQITVFVMLYAIVVGKALHKKPM